MFYAVQHKNNNYFAFRNKGIPKSIIGGNLKTIGNVLGVYMSTVITGVWDLMWHDHVSVFSDNDQAVVMQIKEDKDILNSQCNIIGFSVEKVESLMFDICVDYLFITYGAF